MPVTTVTARFVSPGQGNAQTLNVVSTTGMSTSGNNSWLSMAGGIYLIASVSSGVQLIAESVTVPINVNVFPGAPVVFGGPIQPIVNNPNTLAAAAACFSNQCLGPDDREAIEVWAMINELWADGGTDYRTNLPQLMADSAPWTRLDEDTRRAITLYINIANAINAGASLTENVNSLRKGASCLLCVGWETRRAMKLYLKALLSGGNFPD